MRNCGKKTRARNINSILDHRLAVKTDGITRIVDGLRIDSCMPALRMRRFAADQF